MKKSQNSVIVPDNIERDPSTMVPCEIREAIKAAVGSFRAAMLRCSRLLCRVQEAKLFASWGYDSFGAYVKQELGLEVKHAESLVRIEREVVERGGVSREDVEAMGTTKALALSPLVTKGLLTEENREEIVSVAKFSSVRHLKFFVASKTAVMSTTTLTVSAVRLVFTPSSEQAAIIQRALGLAREAAGGESLAAQLTEICREYILRSDNPSLASSSPVTEPAATKVMQKNGGRKHTRARQMEDQEEQTSDSSSVCTAPLPQANPPVDAAEEKEGTKRKRRASSEGRRVSSRVLVGSNPFMVPCLDLSDVPE